MNRAPTYEQMADDVVAVMNAAHVPRASIVGLSDGGIVGLILAIRQPDLIDRLLAWDASFNTYPEITAPPDPAIKA